MALHANPMASTARSDAHVLWDTGTADEEPEWDTQLHVPLWISGTEASQISARLDGWVQDLLQVHDIEVHMCLTLIPCTSCCPLAGDSLVCASAPG